MKKQPIIYKNQVVGYIDFMTFVDDKIESAEIYIFKCDLYDEIMDNLKRGNFATFDKNPDTEVLENNNLYNYKFENDLLTIKLKV